MAIVLPVLPLLYAGSNWRPVKIDLIYDGSHHIFQHPTAMEGRVKQTYAYKTTGFIKGRTWNFNPYDVRSTVATEVGSKGSVYRWTSLYIPTLSWNGCLSGRLCSSMNTNAPSRVTYTDNDVQRCLEKALAEINTAELDYGTMGIELTETLEMLINPLTGLRKFIRKVARRKHKFKDVAQALSDNWLEFRYGISPFLSDIDSVLNTKSKARLAGRVYRCSSKTDIVKTSTITPTNWVVCGMSGLYIKGQIEAETSQVYTSHVLYRPIIDYTLTGLEYHNTLSVLWEKVPFSFVGDWFVNVGRWLKAAQVNPNILYLGNTVFAKLRTLTTYRTLWACNQVGTTPISPVNGDTFAVETARGYRFVHVPPPALPLVNVDLDSVKRRLDGISLLWQQVAHNFNKRG